MALLTSPQKTIIEHIGGFFEYLDIEKGLSARSQITYERFLNRCIYWLKKNKLEDLKPNELNKDHIWRYRVDLSRSINPRTKEPLKRSTQNYYLIALRNLLKYFSERNSPSLSAEKVKLAKSKADDRRVKFLTLEQIKKLLDAPDVSNAVELRDKAILEILFSTGLRVAELVSLDRDQFKITAETKDLEVVIIGKGNRPRPVYLSPRAVEWLRKYLSTRQDKEKALFINYKGPKSAPKRLSVRSVETIVKKYALLAGIPTFTTPHTIRHSFATDLLTKGVDLREVQEFLGHKNIGTTQIYAHVTSKRLRDIHRKHHSLPE
jgi:site-specific recombinase XerD